jgi:O-antigen ligase
MFALPFHKRFSIAAIVFIIAGIIALKYNSPIVVILPFARVLQKHLWDILLNKTHWLFYLLIFLLPLSTEYSVTQTLSLDFPDEPLMMLLTGLVIIMVLRNRSVFPVHLLKHPLFLFIIMHLFWLLVTVITSTNVLLSAKFFLAKTWFIIPFVIVPSMIKWTVKRFRLLGMLLLLPMLFVVVQSLVRHSMYDFSFEGIKHTLSPYFRNHVTYSSMLVCLLPLVLAMRQYSSRVVKKYLNVLLLIFIAGVIFAYSRGAWLALLCGALAAILLHYKLVKHALAVAAFVVIAGVACLVNDDQYRVFAPDYNTTIYHTDLSDHLQATVQLKDVSNAERFHRWVAAGNMFSENPVTGFGPNTFYENYKSYTEEKFKTWVSDNKDKSTVHNYYLLVLTEQGIPGLALFLLLFLAMIVSCQNIYHSSKDDLIKHLALAIGAIAVMIGSILFSSDLLETDKIGSLFWLCLGFIIVLQNSKELQHQ